MIGRRFLGYFLVLCALLGIVAVLFEAYSVKRAISHSVEQNLLLARSVAYYVSGLLEQEGLRLRAAAKSVDSERREPQARDKAFERVAGSNLTGGGAVLFDRYGRVLASAPGPAVLPPAGVLLPALRHARESHQFVITDLWRGAANEPRVSLILATDDVAVAAHVRIDAAEFRDIFRYFVVARETSLQLLDARGMVLFSTTDTEQFRSGVHGTFLTDKVRRGETATVVCHSCHVDHDRSVRERQVATFAPVPGTPWSVVVRESESALFAPMREMTIYSMGLVILFFGAFAAFYVLVDRGVLRPMHQIAEAAAAVAEQSGNWSAAAAGDDEITVVAKSVGLLRRQSVVVGAELESLRSKEMSTALPIALARGAPIDAEAAKNDLRSMLDAVLLGLVQIDAAQCAILWLETERGDSLFFGTKGVEPRTSQPLTPTLTAVAAGRERVPVSLLLQAGVTLEGSPSTRWLYVRELQASGMFRGQLWIGADADTDRVARLLSPALDVLARQVETLVERYFLYDRLRRQHELKNRMLGWLFDAEDQERKRIARELHDETAQVLSVLLLTLESVPGPEDPEGQQRALQLAKTRVEQLLDEIDRLIRRLRPSVLDDMGLCEAVRAIGYNLLVPSGIEFELHVEGEGTVAVPKDVETVVYRVLQEAATNVVKHAHAANVSVKLSLSAQALTASLHDDGGGVDLSELGEDGEQPGWGLLGMRERLAQIGGTVTFASAHGQGFTVELDVPLRHG